MNAGGILGLMAGLGALSAMNKGGQGGTGKRFTGLMDMLDGGGAGQSGDRFEGGGLLSALGNLFMKPIAAQDNVERIARETNAAKSAAGGGAGGGFTPPVTHQDPYMEEQIESRRQAEAQRMLGMNEPLGGSNLPLQEINYGPQNGRSRPSFTQKSQYDPYGIGSGGEYDGAIKKLPTPTRLEGGFDYDMRPQVGLPKHESIGGGAITNEDRNSEIYNMAVLLAETQDPMFFQKDARQQKQAIIDAMDMLRGAM